MRTARLRPFVFSWLIMALTACGAGRAPASAPAAATGAAAGPTLPAPTRQPVQGQAAAAPGLAAQPRAVPLGINLSELNDVNNEDPFLDHFKLGRGQWLTQCRFGAGCSSFDSGEQDHLDLDAAGWVRSLTPINGAAQFNQVAAFLMDVGDDLSGNDYTGRYVVLYAGQGTLEYAGGAQVVSQSAGRDVIDITSGGRAQIVITAINAADPLRSIRVVRQDNEARLLAGEVFNPAWLAKLAPFGTVRFMDWMRTNNKGFDPDPASADFGQRARVTDPWYTTDKGAPIEVMTALANQIQSDPWFNMPTQASDDYIRQFAAVVSQTLNSNLDVYVEYSNEVWNYGAPFHPDSGYIDQQASLEYADSTAASGASAFDRRMNWHGQRSARVCALWIDVFGAAGAGRIHCVLGAQAANPYTASQALGCPLWLADPDNGEPARACRDFGLDNVAIAPYFGSYIANSGQVAASQVSALSVDALFTEIFTGGVVSALPVPFNSVPANGALAETFGWMDDYDQVAGDYGVRILSYEGGQHLAEVPAPNVFDPAYDPAITNLLFAANRHACMGQAYSQYLGYWANGRAGRPNVNRDVFVQFNLAGRYTVFGSWGSLEHITDATSPKYAALAAFAAGRPQTFDCGLVSSQWDRLFLPTLFR